MTPVWSVTAKAYKPLSRAAPTISEKVLWAWPENRVWVCRSAMIVYACFIRYPDPF